MESDLYVRIAVDTYFRIPECYGQSLGRSDLNCPLCAVKKQCKAHDPVARFAQVSRTDLLRKYSDKIERT